METQVADDWEKRRTALQGGGIYRVLREARNFPAGPNFNVGEEVKLWEITYSPYDSSSVYTFTTQGGDRKSYWLHDSEPLELLASVFEPQSQYGSRAHRRQWAVC
jgi:hypothetical protein